MGSSYEMDRFGKNLLLTLGLALCARSANAHEFQGKQELTGMVGGQAGARSAPAGFKIFTEYGYRLGALTWLNLQFNVAFGNRDCHAPPRPYGGCSGVSATGLEVAGGIKFKFETDLEELVPYAKLAAGAAFIISPGLDDDGIAVLLRPGVGVKYFIMPHLGVGAELNLGVGPLVLDCGQGCSDVVAYVAVEFAAGIEWNF